mgnify:CR=1 FL=1
MYWQNYLSDNEFFDSEEKYRRLTIGVYVANLL